MASLFASRSNNDELLKLVKKSPIAETTMPAKPASESVGSPSVLQQLSQTVGLTLASQQIIQTVRPLFQAPVVKVRKPLPSEYCFGLDTCHFAGNRAFKQLAAVVALPFLAKRVPSNTNEDYMIAERAVARWISRKGHFLQADETAHGSWIPIDKYDTVVRMIQDTIASNWNPMWKGRIEAIAQTKSSATANDSEGSASVSLGTDSVGCDTSERHMQPNVAERSLKSNHLLLMKVVPTYTIVNHNGGCDGSMNKLGMSRKRLRQSNESCEAESSHVAIKPLVTDYCFGPGADDHHGNIALKHVAQYLQRNEHAATKESCGIAG